MGDFSTRRDSENARQLTTSVAAILSYQEELKKQFIELKKSVNFIRQDLRNLDKLKPLKIVEAEEVKEEVEK